MALTKVKVRVKIDHNELLFLLRTSDILVQKPIQDAIEHKMELFAKTVSGFQPLTTFSESSIIDV